MRNRKIFATFLITATCLAIFAGCGKKDETEQGKQQEEKTTEAAAGEKEDKISNTLEVRNNGDAIQWRADSQDSWNDLVKLTELKGADGQDGTNGKNGVNGTNSKNVEIRKEASYIQWRYAGGSWKNLVALSSLAGSSGQNGENVELQMTDSEIQWRYPDGEWKKLVALADITGPAGQDGSDGTDGKTAEFQVDGDTLQWRYSGESVWLNLYDLTTLKGADGSDGQDGTDGKDGVNGTNGKDGVNGQDGANGTDGKTPELRVNGNTLQWRYAGESNWQDLYDLSALKGADGVNGADGQNGTCSGYFYAQGNSTQLNSILLFNGQINNGNLVTYGGAQGTITLKQGHVYQVCFNGSIALGATQSNQSFGAAITDGYDNTQSMNSTLVRGNFGQSGGNSDMSIQVPMTYNRLYDATNGDIVLQYTLINYMLVYTKVDSFQYNLTITALN